MRIRRIGRHLLHHRWRERRIFTPKVLARIEQTIKAGEATHAGQVRFVVEGALDGAPLFRNQPPRERALDIFSRLRIWDTADNNGVLIYLLLADRDVEIIADRGIDRRVDQGEWQAICTRMEAAFAQSRYGEGIVAGVAEISALLARHYPRTAGAQNELPDRPVVL